MRYEQLSEFIYDLKHLTPTALTGTSHLPLAQKNPLISEAIASLLLIGNFVLAYS